MKTINLTVTTSNHVSSILITMSKQDAQRIVSNLGVTPDLADKYVWQFAEKGDTVLEAIALKHGVQKALSLTRRELVNMLLLVVAEQITETVIYGIEQADIAILRARVERGSMYHDECMRTLQKDYNDQKAYEAMLKRQNRL